MTLQRVLNQQTLGQKFVKLSCITDSVVSTLNFNHASRLAEIFHTV